MTYYSRRPGPSYAEELHLFPDCPRLGARAYPLELGTFVDDLCRRCTERKRSALGLAFRRSR